MRAGAKSADHSVDGFHHDLLPNILDVQAIMLDLDVTARGMTLDRRLFDELVTQP